MQAMAIEFARNVLGQKDANSVEFNELTKHNVIDLMEDQKSMLNKGGTMRLGAYPCKLKKESRVASIYGRELIEERHRHRYEFNHKYLKDFEAAGMLCSGINPDSGLVEVIELKDHPWFVGVQYHPEYSSTVLHPHPLFLALIEAAILVH